MVGLKCDEVTLESILRRIINLSSMLLSGASYILMIRIAEPQNDLTDYKFICFNGKVQCSFTCTGRNTENGLHVTFYNRDWQKLPLCPALSGGAPCYVKACQL